MEAIGGCRQRETCVISEHQQQQRAAFLGLGEQVGRHLCPSSRPSSPTAVAVDGFRVRAAVTPSRALQIPEHPPHANEAIESPSGTAARNACVSLSIYQVSIRAVTGEGAR